MVVDFNHRSGFVYGLGVPAGSAGRRINALVDRALVEANRLERPRDYLGASRIGDIGGSIGRGIREFRREVKEGEKEPQEEEEKAPAETSEEKKA